MKRPLPDDRHDVRRAIGKIAIGLRLRDGRGNVAILRRKMGALLQLSGDNLSIASLDASISDERWQQCRARHGR